MGVPCLEKLRGGSSHLKFFPKAWNLSMMVMLILLSESDLNSAIVWSESVLVVVLLAMSC